MKQGRVIMTTYWQQSQNMLKNQMKTSILINFLIV
jgi:hypothetical protein